MSRYAKAIVAFLAPGAALLIAGLTCGVHRGRGVRRTQPHGVGSAA